MLSGVVHLGNRQPDGKRRTHVELAFNLDVTMMILNDAVGHEQP